MNRLSTLLGIILPMILAACDSPKATVREIRENLNDFQRQPNIITLDTLAKSFEKIEVQIEDLKSRDRIEEADLYLRQAKLMREEYLQTRINFLKWSERQSRKSAESQ